MIREISDQFLGALLTSKKDNDKKSVTDKSIIADMAYMTMVIVKRKNEFDNVSICVYNNVKEISFKSYMFVLYIDDGFTKYPKQIFIPISRIIDAKSVNVEVKTNAKV